MLKVHLMPVLRPFAEGAATVTLDADTINDVLTGLSTRFPALAPHLTHGIAIAINGQIHQDQLFAQIPADADVHIMPAIAGG